MRPLVSRVREIVMNNAIKLVVVQRCIKLGSENSHHGRQHAQLLQTKTATVWTCAVLEPNALTVIITGEGYVRG